VTETTAHHPNDTANKLDGVVLSKLTLLGDNLGGAMDTIRVAVAGITGRTGSAVARAIAGAPDMTLVGGVARSWSSGPLAKVYPGAGGEVHGTVQELLEQMSCDVLVDYTSASAVAGHVESAIRSGVNVVVGSSGLTASDFARLDVLAREAKVGVIASGNFSVMAALLQRFAAQAAAHLASWEIIDYADPGKRDVPSGTARALAERLAEVHRPEPGPAPAQLIGPVETRGAEVEGTHVHSVRLPGYYVSTDIIFATPSERMVLRHEPGPGASPYVGGTLLAIRRVTSVTGVLRGLELLLD
jgi:4-hydroxy-tetrahydrodipicolinate reductase